MLRAKRNLLIGILLFGTNILAADVLPRVLVLDDRFSRGLHGAVVNELKGRAQVVWTDPADTSYALAHYEKLLGKDKWDIIHFNLGLPDLCYKDPSIKGIRAMSKSAINHTNYDADSEIAYNGIASKVMSAEKIPANDLHAFALACAKEKKKLSFQDPTVKAILSQLELLKKN